MDEPQILTIDELVAHSELLVPLPLVSEAVGAPRAVRVRKIAMREYLSLLPSLPVQSEDWPAADLEAFRAAERAWLLSLPAAQLEERRRALNELDFRLVSVGAVDPPFTVEQARRLGDDAATVARAIQRFSGLIKPPAAGDAAPSGAGG